MALQRAHLHQQLPVQLRLARGCVARAIAERAVRSRWLGRACRAARLQPLKAAAGPGLKVPPQGGPDLHLPAAASVRWRSRSARRSCAASSSRCRLETSATGPAVRRQGGLRHTPPGPLQMQPACGASWRRLAAGLPLQRLPTCPLLARGALRVHQALARLVQLCRAGHVCSVRGAQWMLSAMAHTVAKQARSPAPSSMRRACTRGDGPQAALCFLGDTRKLVIGLAQLLPQESALALRCAERVKSGVACTGEQGWACCLSSHGLAWRQLAPALHRRARAPLAADAA